MQFTGRWSSIALFVILLGLCSCATNEADSTSTPLVQTRATIYATQPPTRPAQITLAQSSTPTSATAPTATPSPIPAPTKPIFIQYGTFGGDGGYNTDFYFGRDTPELLLYTNGQLLIREGSFQEYQFVEKIITPQEMCHLFSRLKDTGFFNNEIDPIYDFGGTPQYEGGAPEIVVQVNGEPHKQVVIYSGHLDYLVPEIEAAYRLMDSYHPETLTLYKPLKLLLWIEKGRGRASDATQAQPWRSGLPKLTTLLGEREAGQVIIEGDLITRISQLFGDRLSGRLFDEEGQEFFVIARPLLPHETPERFSVYPSESSSVMLSFQCNE